MTNTKLKSTMVHLTEEDYKVLHDFLLIIRPYVKHRIRLHELVGIWWNYYDYPLMSTDELIDALRMDESWEVLNSQFRICHDKADAWLLPPYVTDCMEEMATKMQCRRFVIATYYVSLMVDDIRCGRFNEFMVRDYHDVKVGGRK